MQRIVFCCVLLVAMLMSAILPLHAQSGRSAPGDVWVRLGALSLDTFATQDALDLDETGIGYKAVRLEAKTAGVVISRVQVVWQGAALHTEDRTINLLAGERTRPIAASATPRALSRVAMIYQVPAGPRSTPPLVEVFALQSGAAAASPTTARPLSAPDGSVLIGSQPIGFATDRHVFRTDPNAGEFARVGLKPQQNDVFIDQIRIVFGDGGSNVVNVGRNLTVDGPTHWLDLNTEKPIKEVDVTYRARPNFRGAARLEVFGSAVRPPSAHRSARPARVSATQRAGTPCIVETVCTPVAVFFGTNRERKDVDGHITFTENRADERRLGRATVTVPRAYRKKGEIPRPSWWDLARLSNPFAEDPARHFTILHGATQVYAGEEAFLAAVRSAMAEAGTFKDHAFVFVHGYNVSFEHALYRTAQIAFDLGQDDTPFGTAFLYSWPSAGEVESYIYDLESAEKAVPHLESFLDLVVAKSGAQHVHLIAHSMGNGPLLAALSNIAARGSTSGATINQVILAAPDVDAKDFATLSARILPIARTLTLYASSQDRAIIASRKVRRDLPRAGDVINGVPVIVPGLDTIDVSTVNTGILSLNHSAYADRKELLNDMRRLMLTGDRPPDVRDISISKITEQAGTFWRFTR